MFYPVSLSPTEATAGVVLHFLRTYQYQLVLGAGGEYRDRLGLPSTIDPSIQIGRAHHTCQGTPLSVGCCFTLVYIFVNITGILFMFRLCY